MNNKITENIFNMLNKSDSALSLEHIIGKLKGKFSKSSAEKALIDLRSEGRVVKSKRGKFMVLENSGKTTAKIVSQSKNFSFAKSLNTDDEIFISKFDLKSALIGDLVIIGKIKKSGKGMSGAVEKIIQLGSHTSTGKVMCGLGGLEVFCDSALRYNVPILKGYAMGAKIGDKVKVLLFYKTKNSSLYAKVIKIYGRADSAKVCADAVIDSNEIPTEFSNEATKQAKKSASLSITPQEIVSRADFRNELIFTIDGEDAKDLDDAISIKKLPNGWELGVHIADVSHYVKLGTVLDKEAFKWGTSVYFADRVIPMLPEVVSNGVCSLNKGEDKLTFSAIIAMDKKGEITDYKFVKSVINSKVRGVYSEVNDIISGKASEDILKKYKEVIDCIFHAKEVSDILTKNSQNRGVIDISGSESKFLLDENGKCIDVMLRIQGDSEKIIENFMIVANSAAASYAKNLELPFVYRVHESPDKKKIETLAKLASLLGLKGNKIRPGIKSSDLSDLMKQAEGTPAERVVSRQILQTLAKARYDSKPLGHFGLSLEDYCHFTSPIRRYSDIYVHRVLGEILKSGEKVEEAKLKSIIKKYKEKVKDCSKETSLCEIRAMKAEREAEKYYMAEYMAEHVGEFFDGVISGASSKGVFVELENGVSGFMDLSYYEDYDFEFDGIATHFDKTGNKKLSVGEKIKVKLVLVNIPSALIDFAPAEIFGQV